MKGRCQNKAIPCHLHYAHIADLRLSAWRELSTTIWREHTLS